MLGVMIVMLSLIFYNQLPTGAQKNLLKVLSLLENKFTLLKAWLLRVAMFNVG